MTKKNMANILRIAALLLGCTHFPAANAFVIDSSTERGDTFDVSWELIGDISGGATFTYHGTEDKQINFELTLSNTTSSTNSANAGLIGFGFGTDASFTVASWGDSPSPSPTDTNKVVIFTGTNSSGDPTDEYTPTNRFYAGADPGLAPGESDEFVFSLKLPDVIDPTAQPITFNPLEAFYSTTPIDTHARGGPQVLRVAVPAPGTLVLIGAGLMMIRRRLLSRS